MGRSQKEHDERIHKYSVERMEREALIQSLTLQLSVMREALEKIIEDAKRTFHITDIDEYSSDEKVYAWHYNDGLINGKARCSKIAKDALDKAKEEVGCTGK